MKNLEKCVISGQTGSLFHFGYFFWIAGVVIGSFYSDVYCSFEKNIYLSVQELLPKF